jgi:hypothetical protein
MKKWFGLVFTLMFLLCSQAKGDLIYSVEQIGGSSTIIIGSPDVEFGIFLRTTLVGGNAGTPSQQPDSMEIWITLNNTTGAGGIFSSGITTLSGADEGFDTTNGFPSYDPFFTSVFNQNLEIGPGERVEIARLKLRTTGSGVQEGLYSMSFLSFAASSSSGLPIVGTPFAVPTYRLSAIPEPSSMALLGCIALGGYVIRLRRRNANA